MTPASADYLWQDASAEEWYNSARHNLECTKPISIVHTYLILTYYGPEIYQAHVDYLYDLSRKFAQLIKDSTHFDLVVESESNIVCFRWNQGDDLNVINQVLRQTSLEDGNFYIVGTWIDGDYYLRTSLMNHQTTCSDLMSLLDYLEELAGEL